VSLEQGKNRLNQEITPFQRQMEVTLEFMHGNLLNRITYLEGQQVTRPPTTITELQQDQEDRKETLRVQGEQTRRYRDQVERVLALAGNQSKGENREMEVTREATYYIFQELIAKLWGNGTSSELSTLLMNQGGFSMNKVR